jgi:CubicO group peptidase (beta-lactamase class C family)
MLVDEGKLKWEDKIKDILPGFKLSDPVAMEHLTIIDCLSHRSGLPW